MWREGFQLQSTCGSKGNWDDALKGSTMMNGVGAHEIVVETPRHDRRHFALLERLAEGVSPPANAGSNAGSRASSCSSQPSGMACLFQVRSYTASEVLCQSRANRPEQ